MSNPYRPSLVAADEARQATLVPLPSEIHWALLRSLVGQVVFTAAAVIYGHTAIPQHMPEVFFSAPALRVALPWLLVLAALLWLVPRVVALVTELTAGTAHAMLTQVRTVESVAGGWGRAPRYAATFAGLGTLAVSAPMHRCLAAWRIGHRCTVVYSAQLRRVWAVQACPTPPCRTNTAPRSRRRWPAV